MHDNIDLWDIKVALSSGLTSAEASASQMGSNRSTARFHAAKKYLIHVEQNDKKCTGYSSTTFNSSLIVSRLFQSSWKRPEVW